MEKVLCFSCGYDATDTNPDNIIFTIKDAKLYVSLITLSAKDNWKLSKRLSKGLKDQCIGMNIKQKLRIKIQHSSIDIFSNQAL